VAAAPRPPAPVAAAPMPTFAGGPPLAPARPASASPGRPAGSAQGAPTGWPDPVGWAGGQGPAADGAAGGDLAGGVPATSGWPGFGDQGQPATTIVPTRGKGVRRGRGGSTPGPGSEYASADPGGDRMAPDLGEAERSRLVSLIVFWAPALILLLLAGIVVWVVR
jgi:hypothetical protein